MDLSGNQSISGRQHHVTMKFGIIQFTRNLRVFLLRSRKQAVHLPSDAIFHDKFNVFHKVPPQTA
jgi:hypothetical protein